MGFPRFLPSEEKGRGSANLSKKCSYRMRTRLQSKNPQTSRPASKITQLAALPRARAFGAGPAVLSARRGVNHRTAGGGWWCNHGGGGTLGPQALLSRSLLLPPRAGSRTGRLLPGWAPMRPPPGPRGGGSGLFESFPGPAAGAEAFRWGGGRTYTASSGGGTKGWVPSGWHPGSRSRD